MNTPTRCCFGCKAGINVGLLNSLELALLHALECELHVPVDAVSMMLSQLEHTESGAAGMKPAVA